MALDNLKEILKSALNMRSQTNTELVNDYSDPDTPPNMA